MTIKENLLHSATEEVERIGREVVTGRDAPNMGFGDRRWWLQASLPLLRRRAEEEGALLTLKRKARGGDSPPRR